jgi:hypothetical protein
MKSILVRYFTSIILLTFIVSCSPSDSPSAPGTSTPKEINGTFRDTDGNLLNDVSIYFVYNLRDFGSSNKITFNPDTTSSLSQNFPNPFENSTNFTFEITLAGFTKIYITRFNSDDTLDTAVNGILNEGFYGIFWNNVVPNNLYAVNLWVKISEDSVQQSKIFMLKNYTSSDGLDSLSEANFESFNSTFTIKTNTLPLEQVIAITNESPNILDFKVVDTELTFVLRKSGYKILRETHTISTNGVNKIIFTMERE